MLKSTYMPDNCTNVRHTDKLITSIQKVSLQHNKLQYIHNVSIIFLTISTFAYMLNHRTIIFRWRDRITYTTVLNILA